jgi:Ricin-type beta-trefoil lectin domain-like
MDATALQRPAVRLFLATAGISALLLGARPAAAQWDPRDAALSRCQQELQYRMAREAGGRQPSASIDERRVQVNRVSNNEVRLRGNGRYMRDHNDRGRDFTFDCLVSVSHNSCLDVEGARREDGANIQLWGCSGGANQTWLFRK